MAAFLRGDIPIKPFWLTLAILLLFLNWGLETAKWKRLIREFARPSFFTAFKAILSGVFVSFFTPNRVGEFAGRIVYLKEKRIEASLLTIAGSLSQNICTFVFGCFAALAFFATGQLEWVIGTGVLAISTMGVLFLYFNIDRFASFLRRIGLKRKWLKYFLPIRHLTAVQLGMVLFYSVLRYFVFNLQFLVIFEALNIPISFQQALTGINLLFLIQSFIPSIAVLELTTRGWVTAYAFDMQPEQQPLLFMASYGVWFINLFIPALLGALLFMFNRKDDVGL